MGSIFRKEVVYLSLCLITLFSLASCGSTANRSLAEESEVKRSPPGDNQYNNNKIVNRQFVRDRN